MSIVPPPDVRFMLRLFSEASYLYLVIPQATLCLTNLPGHFCTSMSSPTPPADRHLSLTASLAALRATESINGPSSIVPHFSPFLARREGLTHRKSPLFDLP